MGSSRKLRSPKRNRRSWLRFWCLVGLVIAGVTLGADDGIRIVPLVRDGLVLVSFRLADGFTDDVRAAIHSGLRTTFTYTVELRLEVPAWIDRTIATAVVNNTDQYDNLTRRHSVSRTVDGHVEATRVMEDESVVRQWMTSFDRLPLFQTSKLEANRDYYVRVRATARPSNASFFWPWNSGLSGQAKFTFIP
jgi:hypothetical protein